jgi:hypothetical protein
MNTIPSISEQDIRAVVGEQNLQDGLAYFRKGAISSPVKQGMTLKAHCQGSQPTDYRVKVMFDAKGITEARCSCSVSGRMVKGYYCKHIAALLWTWHEQPQQFSELADVDTTLERSSKSELIALIKQILQQQPDLEWQITPLPTSSRPHMLVAPETYSRQVDTAFRNGGHDWRAPSRIADELYTIKAIGDEFADQHDYINAVTVYEAVVSGVLGNYNSYDDEDGALGRVIEDCVEALDYCMAGEQDVGVKPEAREKILHMLFDIYRFSIDQGVSLADGEDDVPELLLSYVTPKERRTMVSWVRESLQQDTQWRTDYSRQKYGQFLLKLEKDLDDESYLQICRETGRIYDAVERLLKLKRVAEAEEVAEQASDSDLPRIADLFVWHGQDGVAEDLMRQRSRKTQDWHILPWLKKFYLDRYDLEAALDVADAIFCHYATIEGYREIRRLAKSLDAWTSTRSKLLAFLDNAHNIELPIQIALDEGEIDRALELVKRQLENSSSYGWGAKASPLSDANLSVARTVEVSRPRAAIDIYQQHVERLIEQKEWGSYKTACEYLVKIRKLYENLDEENAWASYITDLRKKYNRLRSLKAEMETAGLVR